MRYLCFDIGDKRTGVASGSDETGIATPVAVIESPLTGDGAALVARLARVVAEHEPDAVVVGLPVNMDGTEGPRAKSMRAIGAAIASRTGLPVHLFDERLTSAEADWALAGTGLTHAQKKARRDAIAAAAILRGFLHHRGTEGEERRH